ncbi:hypothetical protein SAMN05216353_13610 [Halobacillus alkaliphilus]|uniref:Uncharacterized protein n=1 Tax=Halobacillus alkaliphilus TaxID=396056 RepID=A0A1I2QZP5_9BACI|nr:hypothetical protein [Halobacillus alkaliphilus]SFG33778.1 hypothetical protein SAMN05216353_13610 [Halobacillus alkaliphilus]
MNLLHKLESDGYLSADGNVNTPNQELILLKDLLNESYLRDLTGHHTFFIRYYPLESKPYLEVYFGQRCLKFNLIENGLDLVRLSS